jgi:cation diffusion facilitator family transporter
MAAKEQSRKVVYAAVAANAGLAIAKFIVAALSGSSAILSEGIHSTVDTANECLLLRGLKRSELPPDDAHPFGHGKELYFWSLIVAVVLFGLGGGVAFYEGIQHLLDPQPLTRALWSYLVLGIAAAFEGYSFLVAYRALGAQHDAGRPIRWWRRVRRSKDPSVFSVFVEDLAALVGIVIAFAGIALGQLLHTPYCDGAASALIGLTLATVAFMLARESRGLLVGESARPEIVASIRETAAAVDGVHRALEPQTMHLSPDKLLVNLDLELVPAMSGDEQIATLERVEAEIRRRHPDVARMTLQPRRAPSSPEP